MHRNQILYKSSLAHSDSDPELSYKSISLALSESFSSLDSSFIESSWLYLSLKERISEDGRGFSFTESKFSEVSSYFSLELWIIGLLRDSDDFRRIFALEVFSEDYNEDSVT